MKNLLRKIGRVLPHRLTGALVALLCTAVLTVLAVGVTVPVQSVSAQQTTSAQNQPASKKSPTPKPTRTPKRTPTPHRTPTPKHSPTPKPPKFCTVCYHNKDKPIRCDKVDEFIRTHPGAKRGPCHVTSTQNR